MHARILTLLLAVALIYTGGAPLALEASRTSPDDDEAPLEFFDRLPRVGTPVDVGALLSRQPASRINSTIMVAALGQLCMLSATGAPVSAIYPFGTGYRNAFNFVLGALNQGDTRPDIVVAAPAVASISPFVIWALGPPPSRLGALSNIPFLAAFGAFVAMGNVLGDTANEIFVGAGPGGPGRVYMLDVARDDMVPFDPFGTEYVGGVRVAAGDLDGDGYAELIVAQPTGGKIKVFAYRSGRFVEVGRGWPFGRAFEGGVHIATGDLNNDDVADLVTSAGRGRSHVRAFTLGAQVSAGTRVSVLADFYVDDREYPNGVRAVPAKLDGTPAIVATAGRTVTTFQPDSSDPYAHALWKMSGFQSNPFGDIADIILGVDVFTPAGERIPR